MNSILYIIGAALGFIAGAALGFIAGYVGRMIDEEDEKKKDMDADG